MQHWLEEMKHPPSTAGTSRIHPGCSRAEHQLETEESSPASSDALTQQLPRFRPWLPSSPIAISISLFFHFVCFVLDARNAALERTEGSLGACAMCPCCSSMPSSSKPCSSNRPIRLLIGLRPLRCFFLLFCLCLLI